MALFLTVSCSKKLNFSTSTIVPAADGSIKYKKSDNGNYAVDIKILHLAEPKKLVPSRNHYVVWMQTESNGIKNLGQITTSTGLFSNTLKSSLKTVTPFKPKSFFITAEDDANISYPGTQVVLRAE